MCISSALCEGNMVPSHKKPSIKHIMGFYCSYGLYAFAYKVLLFWENKIICIFCKISGDYFSPKTDKQYN